jgi:adenine phosphoribosyltransferase
LKDTIEVQVEAFSKGANVFIVDDLLATGGTAEAAGKCVEESGANLLGFVFFLEIAFLNGRSLLNKPTYSVVEY